MYGPNVIGVPVKSYPQLLVDEVGLPRCPGSGADLLASVTQPGLRWAPDSDRADQWSPSW